MIAEISKFIYNNKVYSKCSKEEQEQIDSYLNSTLNHIETLKREVKLLDEEGQLKCELNDKLSKENKQLLERIKKLEDRLCGY